VAVPTCLEDVRGVRKIEGAKVLGYQDAHPSVTHFEVDPDPSLAVTMVDAAGPEALAERFRIGELVREVQQRLQDGNRLPVRALGAGADVRRPQGTDSVD